MIQLDALPKLYGAITDHRRMEHDIQRLLRCNLQSSYLRPPAGLSGVLQYAQKNFFSILFLSIYKALGIPAPRRQFYGLINHCLRGLVTGTDNLLDNEYKEMLPLAFPDSAVRFKSVMHILLFDRFLFQIVDRAVGEGLISESDVDRLHKALFAALVPIGAEEAREEGGVGSILTPDDILASVHMYKGGKLLCLAFVAPRLLEKELSSSLALALAEQGIYSIGMALQIIDDLTDFYEDLRDRNHNYLVSAIHHAGSDQEQALLTELRLFPEAGGRQPIELLFEPSVRRVMKTAIGEALHGFDILQRAGYWLSRRNGYQLIRYLFRLRGVENLLPFFPAAAEATPAPIPTAPPATLAGLAESALR